MTITLSDQQPFAAGKTRRCYVHPHDPDKCIKILIPGGPGNPKKQIYRRHSLYFLRRFIKPLADANLTEWRGYLHARAIKEEWARTHFARHYGFVETDLGLGLVVELLRHDNGDIATPLDRRLQSGADDSFWSAWAEFKECIIQSDFYVRGLFNVLSVRRNGKERLYCAEINFKHPGLIRLPHLARKRRERLLRRMARFEKEISGAIGA